MKQPIERTVASFKKQESTKEQFCKKKQNKSKDGAIAFTLCWKKNNYLLKILFIENLSQD